MWLTRCLLYPCCISRPRIEYKIYLFSRWKMKNPSDDYFAILTMEVSPFCYTLPTCTTSHQMLPPVSLLTNHQWKSGCPVEVRHLCHIRLFGSTNLVVLMTSGIGRYTLCVLHTPVVMPLKPAKAPWTCKDCTR